MADALIDALLSERSNGQPDKPEYIIGASTDGGKRFVAVNRVADNEMPGFECARMPLSGERRYMVVFPHHLVPWVIGTLGACLTDDEWNQAVMHREEEMELRAEGDA